MIRFLTGISILGFLFLTSAQASASAPTPASPDAVTIVAQKAEISGDDINFTTIFDNQTSPVELNSSASPVLGQADQIPAGSYRVLRLTVQSISWHATWSLSNPVNPSPCDGATSGEATGDVDLGGHTDFYFKTPDLGGNTLAYYQTNPPISPSAYVGDAAHPFVLASPITVTKDKVTTVNLVIGVDHTLTCDALGIFDLSGNSMGTLAGPSTRFSGVEGAYVDTVNQEIGVINSGGNSVAVYHRVDNGDVDANPVRTIVGPNTQMNDPEGVVLYQVPTDPSGGEVIVANQGNDSLTVFSRSATGNIQPLRMIVGTQTGLSRPAGVALYLDPGENPALDEIFVANQGNNSLTVYNRIGSENQSPLRQILREDFTITSSNNTISLTETGTGGVGTTTATIASGVYATGDRLAAAVAAALNAATSASTTLNVAYDPATRKFSITVKTLAKDGTLTLNWGDTAGSTAATVLGFNPVNSGDFVAGDSVTADSGDLTGLDAPCGIYVDPVNDEIGVTNSGNGTVTIFNRTDNGNVAPKRTITGLNDPCGLYVDPRIGRDEIAVANRGDGTVKVFDRTSGTLKLTATGLNDPRALYLDSNNGEVGVVQQSQQAVMAFMPAIFPAGANDTASNSILSGNYNVTLYGVDLKGMNGHGVLVPVLFAERGTATFDSTTVPWPSFSLLLDTQIRRQILEPACPLETDFNIPKIGFYGVNDDDGFYAFLPNMGGSLRGAFVPDGSVFVGSMVDSSNKLMLVYGVRTTGSNVTPFLTSDGTSHGNAAQYAFTSYRNDLFSIQRLNNPPQNDLFRYVLAIGMAGANDSNFVGTSADTNFVTVLNPTGEFAAPESAGPSYTDGGDSNLAENYSSVQGGLLNSPLLDGLTGAVDAGGATLIFMRNTATTDTNGCWTDIGFGMGLRQSPSGTFHAGSLKGTYFLAGFGDQYGASTQTTSHRSTEATLTFDGNGNVEIQFVENQSGVVSVDHATFTYRVSSRTVPQKGSVRSTVDVVDIFDRVLTGPFASALIGDKAQTLAFFKNLNPGNLNPAQLPNTTRLVGLALFQHP